MKYPGDATRPRVLVCGSIAIDLIGQYRGSFEQYQQKFPVNALNISLQLAGMHTTFGGCGMNITYGLTLVGVDAIPLTSAGRDFRDHYQAHLESNGITTHYIAVDERFENCASCILLGDDLGNQITAFHSGAAVSDQRVLPSEIDGIDEFQFAVLAPEDAPIMLRQARDLSKYGFPVMFDPGQGLAEFKQDELRELLELCDYSICNDHEFDIMQTNAGLSAAEIINQMQQVIVTNGDKGVDIYEQGRAIHVPAVEVPNIVDTTGCGDAFRAGYVLGKVLDLSTTECGRLGNMMAAENLQSRAPQEYHITREDLFERYTSLFGEPLVQ